MRPPRPSHQPPAARRRSRASSASRSASSTCSRSATAPSRSTSPAAQGRLGETDRRAARPRLRAKPGGDLDQRLTRRHRLEPGPRRYGRGRAVRALGGRLLHGLAAAAREQRLTQFKRAARSGQLVAAARLNFRVSADCAPTAPVMRASRRRIGCATEGPRRIGAGSQSASRPHGRSKEPVKSRRGPRKSRNAFTFGGCTRPPGRTA